MKKKNNESLSKELDELLNQQLFKSPVGELSKKYETKLAEVTNAYNKLKEELYALSAKVNPKNVKTNKTKDE